ncbi:MAG: hypothetical protein KY445_06915, partial [Armatimonadetes bacterium]|nr:hypothetical protein [Armatimonadota bacterium]
MAKRFSARETALLMAPVVFVGALGWWLSKPPQPVRDNGPLRLSFRVEPPTTLEAFQGMDGAFVVEAQDRKGKSYLMNQAAPTLELKTARGIEVSRFSKGTTGFWTQVWNSNSNNSRFTFNLGPLPPGTLHFGFDGMATLPSNSAPPPPVRVHGKWKVDRAKIQPPNLAAMPRNPLVSLREVV